jgi:DNA-binding NarL/FixJ family response regulator
VNFERLTATEARIAGLLARGYADGEITAELAVRPQNLQYHLAEVYRKLGVRSRTELALLMGTGETVSESSGGGVVQ